MITRYTFENFLSFKEKATFDLTASPTKVRTRYPDNFNEDETGLMPLKTSVIVGENAGGKSNFIKSINYLKSLFKENRTVRSSRSTINTNNLNSNNAVNENLIQKFEIEIIINGTIYCYKLIFDQISIITEELLKKNKKNHKFKTLMWAERNSYMVENGNEYTPSYRYSYDFITENTPFFTNSIINSLEKNSGYGLFVTRLAILGEEHAMEFTKWMNDSLFAESILVSYDIQKDYLSEEDDLRILNDKRYLDILKMVDYSIIDYEIDLEKPYSKTNIIRKKADGTLYKTELDQDSTGVREFFAWATQVFRVVYEDKVVFADEMDRVLNPILSDRVISFINGSDHHGQFIITTHNVMHLDFKSMMKEQMYFITKDIENINSDIYSLADFPDVRYETTKIYEFYMKGVLGGTSYA